MMRFLIVGGTGMLGHKLVQAFSKTDEVVATARRPNEFRGFFPDVEVLEFDVSEDHEIPAILDHACPDVVINCIGVIKQLSQAKDPLVSIPVNSLFPHQLARACSGAKCRMVHVSTDCVFSGKHRIYPYTDNDVPDPLDLYGRTKLLGEVCDNDACLTIRTSIIGREAHGCSGLMEWFLSQRGKTVKGFSKALYTGFTTIEFSRVIRAALATPMSGLVQASSDPISKFDLLSIAKEKYGLDVVIEKDEDFACDRRLDSSLFRRLACYQPPTWQEMMAEMAADPTPYEKWRRPC